MKDDFPPGVTREDILEAHADEEFFGDFLQRQAARSPYNRAARLLRQHLDADPELANAIKFLRERASLELRETDPRRNKSKGVHLGQLEGAVCRQLLVLSVYAEHSKQGGSLEAFVPDHGLSFPAWQKWINDDEVRAHRDEVQRTGLMPVSYGVREPIPAEMWPTYAARIGWLSGRVKKTRKKKGR